MRGGAALAISLVIAGTGLSCVEIPSDDDEILSFQFDPLPSPSVTLGDTLRDSLGTVRPLTVTAFNYRGETILTPDVRFRVLDRRIRVDSITGIVIGDSATATVSRVLASLDGFTGSINVPVSLRPDTVVGSNARDSLAYSLTDTATNVSNGIGVRVLHGPATADSAVTSYRVTFDILSPADTALARLLDESNRRSRVDTTDATGIARRRVRIDVARLTSAVDSVIAQANVTYRGQHVKGSPMRLVLKLKPR